MNNYMTTNCINHKKWTNSQKHKTCRNKTHKENLNKHTTSRDWISNKNLQIKTMELIVSLVNSTKHLKENTISLQTAPQIEQNTSKLNLWG